MGDGQADGLRYTAFLSYSHKDAAAAGRLHRKLETYRMPKRLVGTETARGPVPSRLAPIFRDREELPAATDLSETVREALAQSGALIVLCSPAAAASLWVAEEIETFRRIHPDRPVLAAILDGDPPDCFPRVLRAFGQDGSWHEPLATDLRRHCDGPRLGLLKLVAGITGVGVDALVQRDAARKVRRVMSVTGAALAAMLIMAALALVAIDARGEAERQRAEAERQRAATEGQIEFMLTDLRTRLRGVGRIDIMAAVNQHALRYYRGQQELGRLSATSLERRARLLHAVGEDDLTQGNFNTALAAFTDAHETTAEQLQRAPNDPARIFAHAQSEYWIGSVHEQRQRWPVARYYYRRYAADAARLIRLAGGNPDYMMEMGFGAHNLGIAQLNMGDPAGAERLFRSALQWFAKAARARPGDRSIRREQANSFAYLADTFYVRRRWRDSLAARLEEHRIKAELQRADPANSDHAYRLAIAERSVALLSARVGNHGAARDFIRRAHEQSRRLTERDSRNANWALLRAKIECDLQGGAVAGNGGMSDSQLRRSIGALAGALQAQHNPRIGEMSICLERIRVR